MESLLNYSKETQETRLLCEGWTKDTTGHVNVAVVVGNNAGLNTRAVNFAKSTVVELIGRFYAEVFLKDPLFPPNIDFNIKLMPLPNNFVCKSAAPAAIAAQQNFKLIIQSVYLTIHTKQLTRTTVISAHGVFLIVKNNMKYHLSRVQIKHLIIPANLTSINFDVLIGALPNLIIIDLVSDAELAGDNQK